MTAPPPLPPPGPVPATDEDRESRAVVWWIISLVYNIYNYIYYLSLIQILHSISDRAISWLLLFPSGLL